MKNRLVAVASLGLIVLLAGCTAAPTKPAGNAPGATYLRPEADVQKAVIEALTANGFEIKKSESQYVEGSRPRKVGLVVGSGGESAGVWLEPLAPNKTAVKVSTAKTFVGGAGQKNWDKEILAEMDKAVGPRQ